MKSLNKSPACDEEVLLLSGLICQRVGFRVGFFLRIYYLNSGENSGLFKVF